MLDATGTATTAAATSTKTCRRGVSETLHAMLHSAQARTQPAAHTAVVNRRFTRGCVRCAARAEGPPWGVACLCCGVKLTQIKERDLERHPGMFTL